MSTSPDDRPDTTDREQAARERVDEMPAETALGNADAAGAPGDPETYRNVQNDDE